jgi:2-polyprenyl-3-methyl-5-hydroxy-6-metoxy-1,4-benzoquinol methylase
MSAYRTRIYEKYASVMQDAKVAFNEEEAQRWGRAYGTFLKGWLPERKDASILEVGCGWGRLLYFLKTRGYVNLQGVDISPEQVKLARQVIDNVTEGDAIEYLDNHPHSFALIIGLDIIEHFRKDEVLHFLEACYKALLPGGRLILQTPNAGSPWGMMCRYGDFTHEVALDPNSLKRLLALTGFHRIEGRQAGPVIHGILSLGRYFIWKMIWLCLALWNLAETGDVGSGIYTRVFLMSGTKT